MSDEEYNQLFDSFQCTAFRLEVRDRYNVPYEAESLRKFLAGEPDERLRTRPFLDWVRKITSEGKRIERVRVVSLPLTDYSRYGLWSCQTNNEAGEDIRYLARDRAEGLPDHDYWLFDSRHLVRMHFDRDDRFVGAEVIDDPPMIVQHNYWRDLARHLSGSREQFAAE